MDLKRKVALVTGAGAGIGHGCAVELARAGGSIVLNDKLGILLQGAAASIEKVCGRTDLSLLMNDIFNPYDADTLVRDAIKMNGKIDVLVTGPASTVRKPALEHVLKPSTRSQPAEHDV